MEVLKNSNEVNRQHNQLEFEKSGKNIIVGTLENFPLTLKELVNINEKSPNVDFYSSGGFTSEVFRLNIGNKKFTLKKKRDISFVKNIDGRTAFLNEVQRRDDFNNLKKQKGEMFKNIVDTVYADFKNGIILSPWIDGEELKYYNENIINNLFSTLYNMDINGIFECDLCSGNLLIQPDENIKLYDFGYTYTYDPLNEYNPDGKYLPIFHFVERFETRTFMQHLMDIEDEVGIDRALELFSVEKKLGLKYYQKKLEWLEDNNADTQVIEWIISIIDRWDKCLATDELLLKLYKVDSFRSYLLEVHDDVGGKCCNPDTIIKINRVIKIIENNYNFILENGGLFWGDEKLSYDEVINKYKKCKFDVLKYQNEDKGPFYEWKKRRLENIRNYYKTN